MSWYGTHPVISKAEARKLLPGRATRHQVYYVRVHPNEAWHYRKGRTGTALLIWTAMKTKCQYALSNVDWESLFREWIDKRKLKIKTS